MNRVLAAVTCILALTACKREDTSLIWGFDADYVPTRMSVEPSVDSITVVFGFVPGIDRYLVAANHGAGDVDLSSPDVVIDPPIDRADVEDLSNCFQSPEDDVWYCAVYLSPDDPALEEPYTVVVANADDPTQTLAPVVTTLISDLLPLTVDSAFQDEILLPGLPAHAHFGGAMTVGDVNADDIDDALVSAFGDVSVNPDPCSYGGTGTDQAGSAYLFYAASPFDYGSRPGLVPQPVAETGFGPVGYYASGISLTDLDNDGDAEVIVSNEAGGVEVTLGGGGATMDLANPTFTYTGTHGPQYGTQLATAPPDTSGQPPRLVAANPFADSGNGQGFADILELDTTGSITLSPSELTQDDEFAANALGGSAIVVADFDGDADSENADLDIVLGGPGSSEIQVYRRDGTITGYTHMGSHDVVDDASQYGSWLAAGAFADSGGDNEGWPDVVVGEPRYTHDDLMGTMTPDVGRVEIADVRDVLLDGSGANVELEIRGDQVYGSPSAANESFFGTAVDTASVVGAYYTNLIVGAPGHDTDRGNGDVWFFPTTNNGDILVGQAQQIPGRPNSKERLGSALAHGDFNDDFSDDLLVGAPCNSDSPGGAAVHSGRVLIQYGPESRGPKIGAFTPILKAEIGDPVELDGLRVPLRFPESIYTCVVDWGDGTVHTQDCDDTFPESAGHIYDQAGVFNIRIEVIHSFYDVPAPPASVAVVTACIDSTLFTFCE